MVYTRYSRIFEVMMYYLFEINARVGLICSYFIQIDAFPGNRSRFWVHVLNPELSCEAMDYAKFLRAK